MRILAPLLPLGKSFFKLMSVPAHDTLFFSRFILACLSPRGGRFTAASVALCLRLLAIHRGQVGRKLRRLDQEELYDWMREVLYSLMSGDHRGLYLFVIDSTYCPHQGCPENLTRTGQHGKMENHTPKEVRNKRKQHASSGSHCFVMGLLLSPDGLRWPCFKSYYTKEYCGQYGHSHLTQAELAALLIEELKLPSGAQVVVVGDAAFDAAVVLKACRKRSFDWVLTMNTDRVLAGPTPAERAKALSLTSTCSAEQFVPVRLTPGEGSYELYRRSALCRLGLKRKSRTFWVCQVDTNIHNVGEVRLLLSTKQEVQRGQAVRVQKVLMTSLKRLEVADITEIYDLRWQIEIYRPDCPSRSGLYRNRRVA